MLFDLNINWTPSTTQEQLLQILSLASTFGYGTVALNHTFTTAPANSASPFPAPPSSTTAKLPKVLHRATVTVADPAAPSYRLLTLNNVYDIIAVRPTTEKAFQNACLTLDIPIISMDMAQHYPFHFRPKPCMAAVSRGVRFEVCYAQALAADARGRANFIANVANLVRATRGRGIVISSEARTAMGLRAPADVVNLMSVWGLANDKGLEGLGSVPRSIVVNEGIKRSGFRGVIDVVEVAERDKKNKEVGKEGSDTATDKSDKLKGKRKMDQEPGQGLSKKQAKKMKLAARGDGLDRK